MVWIILWVAAMERAGSDGHKSCVKRRMPASRRDCGAVSAGHPRVEHVSAALFRTAARQPPGENSPCPAAIITLHNIENKRKFLFTLFPALIPSPVRTCAGWGYPPAIRRNPHIPWTYIIIIPFLFFFL